MKMILLSRVLCIFIFFYPLLGHCATLHEFWNNLWQTQDQEAAFYMQQKDYKKAGQTFQNKSWQGAALYKAQEYTKAAQVLAAQKNIEDQYNFANTLAHLHKYQQALDIYNAVLKQNPNHKDAKFNYDLLKKLLDQKSQQDQNKDSKKNQPQDTKQDKTQQENQNQQKQDNNDKQNKPNNNHPDDKPQSEEPKNNSNAPKEEAPKTQAQQKQEQQQKTNKQWLKLIPDDPGGLLKQQFLRDHLRRTSRDEK